MLDLCAQDFMDWLAPGAVFIGRRSEAFQSLAIEADLIQEALRGEELELEHLEIQSTPDANIEQRLLEYNILAWRRYRRFVNSYVIFLRDGGEDLKPPLVRTRNDGRQGLWFDYEVILMRHKTPGEILEQARGGVWALIPFTKGGATREVIEEVINRLTSFSDARSKELISLTGLFASLAFRRKADQEWLERKLAMADDILSEAPLYKKLARQGEEKGLKKGVERGKKQGITQGRILSSRKALLVVVTNRFPQLSTLAKKTGLTLDNPDILEQLLSDVVAAHDGEEARNYLVAALEKEQQKGRELKLMHVAIQTMRWCRPLLCNQPS